MPYQSDAWASERGRLGHLTLIGASAEQITESRRKLLALRMLEHVRGWLAGDLPPTRSQRDAVAELLKDDLSGAHSADEKSHDSCASGRTTSGGTR